MRTLTHSFVSLARSRLTPFSAQVAACRLAIHMPLARAFDTHTHLHTHTHAHMHTHTQEGRVRYWDTGSSGPFGLFSNKVGRCVQQVCQDVSGLVYGRSHL